MVVWETALSLRDDEAGAYAVTQAALPMRPIALKREGQQPLFSGWA
jgi:hypothetical protein